MKGGKKQFEKDEYIYDDYVPPRNSKGAMRGGSARTAEWEQGSRNKVEEQQFAESKRKASEYTFSKPWDLTSHDAVDDFQKHVAALDYQTVPPWAGVPTDGDVDLTRKLSAISGYEYQPLWKPIEQTMQRMHQNANYRIDPPFQTQYTPSPDSIKPSKRPISGHNPKTLAPWEHGMFRDTSSNRSVFRSIRSNSPLNLLMCITGSQPRASEPMKVQFDMPSTGFWSVPETKPETLIESSGDPVLDSLRLQLKKHGTINSHACMKTFDFDINFLFFYLLLHYNL